MAATLLDSNAKSAGIALSGGNLVATSSAAGTAASTRNLTGKHYFEGVITTLTGTPSIGLLNHISGFSTALLGADVNSLAYRSSGAVVVNNVTLSTIAAYVAGDRVDGALDPANRLVWFRVNGGNWNNNVANDPATGVGGIDISSMTLGTLRAAIGASVTGTVWTMKFSTAFTGAAPSGYASLDSIQTTIGNATFGYAAYSVAGPDFATIKGQATLVPCGLKMFNGTANLVSGILKELSVVIANKKIRLYDAADGRLLGSTTSAGDGSFSIPALGRPKVYAVAFDPPYNALVFDNITPI